MAVIVLCRILGVVCLRLQGKVVSLRSIESDDYLPLWELIYGEENPEWKKWDDPFYVLEPIDLSKFTELLQNLLLSSVDVPYMMIIERDAQIIGVVTYYWEQKPSLSLEVGIVIYKPDFWNGGYGTEALALWIDYHFRSLPLVRVGLSTWSGNTRMIRSAEKLGMQLEGRLRKARLVNGTFYDSIRMGILREEWAQREAVQN